MKLSGYDESPNAALDRHLGSAKLVYNLRIREIIRRRLQTKGGNIVYFLHVIFPLLSTSFMLSFRPRERRSGNADASPASPFGFESRFEPEVSIVPSRDTSGRFPASARCPGPVAIDPLSLPSVALWVLGNRTAGTTSAVSPCQNIMGLSVSHMSACPQCLERISAGLIIPGIWWNRVMPAAMASLVRW